MLSSISTTALAEDGFNQNLVQGEITYYTHRTDLLENGTYKRYADEFKKLYPKVTNVKVLAFADYPGGLRPRMNTSDYGDVIQIIPSVPSSQYANFYEPLNNLFYMKTERSTIG